MVTTILAFTALAQTTTEQPLKCAAMQTNNADMAGASVLYGGAQYFFCCGGCDKKFSAEPTKFTAMAAKSGATIGKFMFDPITGKKADLSSAITTDFHGLRYYFANEGNKKKFLAKPESFATSPAKEALTCAVAGDKMASPADAFAYVDFKGVRYYMCCAGCLPKMQKEPAKYAKKVKATPVATTHS